MSSYAMTEIQATETTNAAIENIHKKLGGSFELVKRVTKIEVIKEIPKITYTK